jgi:thiamine-phosphate pyrophosphorylase
MNNTTFSPERFLVIDANRNRLKEGIRGVEDILRYNYNNKEFSTKLKNIRHQAKISDYKKIIQQRDSVNDVLKPSTKSEQNRETLEDIIISNFKRAQESSRVLEELFKLYDIEKSEIFKSIRYDLYSLEKEIILTI